MRISDWSSDVCSSDLLVRTGTHPLLPAGFGLGDAHGFPAGQSVEFAIRDSAGRTVARETLSTSVGPTVGDLVADLNASPLASIGTFSLDSLGRLQLTPSSGSYSLVVVSDSTDRPGTNAQLSDLLGAGVGRTAQALESAELRSEEHTSELQSLMRISYAVFC